MNLSAKLLSVVSVMVLLMLVLLAALQANASVSSYTASSFSQYCSQNTSTCNKINFSNVTSGSVSCPSENQVIDKVYVHAGGGQTVYELPDSGFNVTYSNNNNTATVSLATHPNALSFLGVVCSTRSVETPTPTIEEPTPTPTTEEPTPTPTTEEPTPTPTTVDVCSNIEGVQESIPEGYHAGNTGGTCFPNSCPEGQTYDTGLHICIQCTTGTCEVVIGSPTPTETVTLTPTPTATATPTPKTSNSSSGGDGRSDGRSDGGSSTVQAATGSSDSITSMANTGMFGNLVSKLSVIAGLALTSFAVPGYAKRKNK